MNEISQVKYLRIIITLNFICTDQCTAAFQSAKTEYFRMKSALHCLYPELSIWL